MNTDPTHTPDLWSGNAERGAIFRVPDSPDPGEFVGLTAFPGKTPIERIIVWHWHTPTNAPARWMGAGVSKHQLISLDPLHLEPSLGCIDGCPAHGWIREGRWVQA